MRPVAFYEKQAQRCAASQRRKWLRRAEKAAKLRNCRLIEYVPHEGDMLDNVVREMAQREIVTRCRLKKYWRSQTPSCTYWCDFNGCRIYVDANTRISHIVRNFLAAMAWSQTATIGVRPRTTIAPRELANLRGKAPLLLRLRLFSRERTAAAQRTRCRSDS